jgi:hypothetical protein
VRFTVGVIRVGMRLRPRKRLRGSRIRRTPCAAPDAWPVRSGYGGRSSTRESCLTRCPRLRTGHASAAAGWMRQVTPWTTPTGSNEPLYGRTDTKSPMVYSSMVHVAGGEEGSIRHNDEVPGRGCLGGAAPSSGEAVRGQGVAHGRTDRGRARAPCCCDRAPGGSPGTATPAIR